MQKRTEKRIETTKSKKGKSTKFSSTNRTDNSFRFRPKRLRSTGESPKRNAIELFVRSNNLRKIPFVIKCDHVEQEAINIIRDIYPIIKDEISIFISPKITEKTSPIEFLTWMMNCYTDIYDEWEISKGAKKYMIKRLIDYNIEPVGYSLELKFIENINDEEIYNVLIIAFSLMKRYGVPFWDNSYSIEMVDEMIEDELEELLLENKKEYEDDIERLNKGKEELIAMDFLMEKINSNKTELKEFIIIKNNLIAKNKLSKTIITFFDYLESFLNIKDNIFNYVSYYQHEIDDGNPVMPFEYAQIAYNLDDDSYVGYHLNQYSTDAYNNYGAIPFRDEVINEVENGLSDYPYRYIELLNLALEVEKEYSNY